MDRDVSRRLESLGDRLDVLARKLDPPFRDELHFLAFEVKKVARGQ